MRFERRPWGWFLKIIDIGVLWVKIIRVRDGEMTSRQRHYLRSELHIGWAKWGYRRFIFKHVPRREMHRLHSGIYLEIAWGEVLERDIERFDDKYGRKK